MKSNFLVKYIRDSITELTKVKWPTRSEIISTTLIVVISITLATAMTAAIDFGLAYLVQYLVQTKS